MNEVLPVILLKKLIILPNQDIKIELSNRISKIIIKNALLENNGKILVVAPIDNHEESPSINDLPRVGVVATVKNKIQLSNGNVRVSIRGLYRVVVNEYKKDLNNENILNSNVIKLDLPKVDVDEEKATKRKLIEVLEQYIDSSDKISNSIINVVKKSNSLDKITDIITSFMPFDINDKLKYMQNINPIKRAKELINDIKEEIKSVEIDEEIEDLVQTELVNNQREFILKEKINVIKKELGEKSFHEEEVLKYQNKLNNLKLNKNIADKINREIERFSLLNELSPETGVVRGYLDWIMSLPWNKYTTDEKDYKRVIENLDKTHFGLNEVKERIAEFVAVKKINKKIKSPIICLVGPPGVGKTSVAMSIATALNRRFYKISVGGLNDSTELIGSRKTYLGANPGKIIQGLRKCNSKNPVFLIDEVDKMVKDYKGDPASTLLEIIDPIQNEFFVDNYIEECFDLRDVLFILTANDVNDIPPALQDRVEIIKLSSYTMFEKKDIAKKYLLPQIYKEHKIKEFDISDDILLFIINNYTNESGVRDLERVLTNLIRKMIINNIKDIDLKKIKNLLGKESINELNISNTFIGMANVLSISNSGGKVLKIECIKTSGKGNVEITGLLGEIAKESVEVALSFIKAKYNYNFDKYNIHIHILNGGIKKEGTSAGVSIVSSIISLMENKIILEDIAFTGEISLNGIILPVGGIKEKIISAFNNNIKTIYIPLLNKSDINDVPKEILSKINIKMVSNYDEIYKDIFAKVKVSNKSQNTTK